MTRVSSSGTNVGYRAEEASATARALHWEDPRLHGAVAKATSPKRAGEALAYFAAHLAPLPESLIKDVEALLLGAGSARDLPDSEGVVPPANGARALESLRDLDAITRARLAAILDATEAPLERALLLKSIGARKERLTSDEAIAEIAAHAREIRGKPRDWLIANSTAYGLTHERPIGAAEWAACVPATAYTAHLENDPIELLGVRRNPARAYAMQAYDLRQNGAATPILDALVTRLQEYPARGDVSPVVRDTGGALAQLTAVRQRRERMGIAPGTYKLFERVMALVQSGEATPDALDKLFIDNPQLGVLWRTVASHNRAPMTMRDTINPVGKGLGVNYEGHYWFEPDKRDPALSLDVLERVVRDGFDVPLRLLGVKDGQPTGGHQVLLVDCRHTPEGRVWRVYDPAPDVKELAALIATATQGGAASLAELNLFIGNTFEVADRDLLATALADAIPGLSPEEVADRKAGWRPGASSDGALAYVTHMYLPVAPKGAGD